MKLPSFTRNAPFYIEWECRTTFNMYYKEIKLIWTNWNQSYYFYQWSWLEFFWYKMHFIVRIMIDFLVNYSNFLYIYDKVANYHLLHYAEYQLCNYQNECNCFQLSHRFNYIFWNFFIVLKTFWKEFF